MTIVLIHGGWHGAWCWERVTPLIEMRGHRVVAPDLPGMGADRTPLASVTLESWARFVVETVEREQQPVVLAGHSRAGVIISQAAEYAPHAIRGLIYVAAFLVPDGHSMRSAMMRVPRDPKLPVDLVPSANGVTVQLKPDAVARTFYNTTDPVWTRRAASLVGDEPSASITTPVALSPERFGSRRRAYVECLQDKAIPIELQRLMQVDLPCETVATLDTDHSPFYSAPAALADLLVRQAEAFG